MLKKTNLQKIKEEVSIPFLYLDIYSINDLFVLHPYLTSAFITIKDEDGESKLVNVVEDETACSLWRTQIKGYIHSAKKFMDLYMLIRESYQLTFLKYAKKYMSLDDFSYFFADAWTSSENPNQDINCSIALLTQWFRNCNKKYLMQEEEYQVYCSLPDEMVVYRGVAVDREPAGLSWTQNLKKAEWFAQRFNDEKEQGYMQKATVRKENILAYFNRRNEDEIVVDVKQIHIEKMN